MNKPELSSKEMKQLLEQAREAFQHAYTPYSDFRVGAALLCEDSVPKGAIIQGCNVENVSYGLSICAERCAIVKAASLGYRQVKAIAVVANKTTLCYPCGTCLQFIREFGHDITIVLEDHDRQPLCLPISQLLPYAFTSDNLKRYGD